MRVVLDSNVIIAAYATHGLCHTLFELCLVDHTLFISQDILDEVGDALQNRIKIPAKVVKDILSFLKKNSILETPAPLSPDLCRDPEDVKILGLAVAVAGHADCLVSGDNDLLVMRRIEGVPILSPRDFYNLLQKEKLT
jgi:putative PIN family toxin of toxin-antitoxin system